MSVWMSVLAQASSEGPSAAGGIAAALFLLVYLAVLIVIVVGAWKIFTKANQPGWASIIPIYNCVVLLNIVGRPVWWVVLMLIPLVNVIVGIMVTLDLAKSFGKGTGYGLGLLFLPFIFIPMLGFGDARYNGPSAS